MEKITAKEFAGRIIGQVESHRDDRFAFFFGSGCSFSSDIPTAGKLVEEWLI